MGEEHVPRRLAAILSADVVSYTRLMEADEQGTLAQVKVLQRDVLQPEARRHGGRIFKTIGDGALIEFANAVDAVRAAIGTGRSHLLPCAGWPFAIPGISALRGP